MAGMIEVIARGLVRRDDSVLLCRSVKHGYRYLPGGHVEAGESAAEAVAREFAEECGLTVQVGLLIGVLELRFDQGGRERHEYTLVFHVEHRNLATAGIKSREPKIAFDWIPLADLEKADLRPAQLGSWIREMAAARGRSTVWHSGDDRSS